MRATRIALETDREVGLSQRAAEEHAVRLALDLRKLRSEREHCVANRTLHLPIAAHVELEVSWAVQHVDPQGPLALRQRNRLVLEVLVQEGRCVALAALPRPHEPHHLLCVDEAGWVALPRR
eukprot:scaffold237599_cov37-Tisochrysis_lutea.AAC.2